MNAILFLKAFWQIPKISTEFRCNIDISMEKNLVKNVSKMTTIQFQSILQSSYHTSETNCLKRFHRYTFFLRVQLY